MAGKKDMAGKFEYGAPLDRWIDRFSFPSHKTVASTHGEMASFPFREHIFSSFIISNQ